MKDCKQIINHHLSADLLRYVLFRLNRPQSVDGEFGAILSIGSMMEETGSPERSVLRALVRLKEAGLITTKQMHYGGRKQLLIVLTSHCASRLASVRPTENQGEQSCQIGNMEDANLAGSTRQAPYISFQLKEKTSKVGVHSHAVATFIPSPKRDKGKQESKRGEDASHLLPLDKNPPTKAPPAVDAGVLKLDEESYAEVRTKNPGTFDGRFAETHNSKEIGTMNVRHVNVRRTSKPKPNTTTLVGKWMDLLVSAKHAPFATPLTQQQIGQLKDFERRCPEGMATSILEQCMKNWSRFIVAAKIEAGAFPLPEKPQIGFLLKHVQVAVCFCQAPPPLPQEHRQIVATSPGYTFPSSPKVRINTPAEAPPTPEEVLAILNGGPDS